MSLGNLVERTNHVLITPPTPTDGCLHLLFQVLDLLWSLSHLPSLTTEMVDQALRSHNDILSDSYAVKEQIKKNYAVKCMEDIRKGVLIVPAIRQLLLITKGMLKQQFNKHDKVWHVKFVDNVSLCICCIHACL